MTRLSEYRIMWIITLFDLPTETKADRKRYTLFRKSLLQDGFQMFQFSIYWRHCASRENSDVHIQRVKKEMPSLGSVAILRVTDKQFGQMEIFHNALPKERPKEIEQLEMFIDCEPSSEALPKDPAPQAPTTLSPDPAPQGSPPKPPKKEKKGKAKAVWFEMF